MSRLKRKVFQWERIYIIDRKIKFEDKEIHLKKLKSELKEAKSEIRRFQNTVSMKFKGEISEINRISEILKQKVETLQFHLHQLEQAKKDQFEDKYNLVAKSWKELYTYLDKV
jgi:hypothetical protein